MKDDAELITEKQIKYIYKILRKEKNENFDYNQLKNITKQEAHGIIQRNIIKGSPLYQWYIWKKQDKSYVCTTKGNKPNFMFSNSRKQVIQENEIEIIPIIFLNKRLAEEYYGQKLEFRSPYREVI